MVEIPIFEQTLTIPLPTALTYFCSAFSASPGEQALADHVVQRLEGQVGVDGAGAVAEQQREVVHLARLAALEHQADARARPLAQQVVLHRRDRQQRRDRRPRRGRARGRRG